MNIKITHLHSPYTTLATEEGRMAFSEILSFRLKSYQQRYGDNVFPFGAEDFFSEMISISDIETKRTYASFKYTSHQSCLQFKQEFPLLHTLSDPINPRNIEEHIRTKLQIESAKKNFAYMGSFTVEETKDLSIEKRKLIRNFVTTAIVGIVNQNKTDEVLVTGSIPNGSCNFIQSLGFEKVSDIPLTVWDIGKTTAYLLSWNGWSEKASAVFQNYQEFWWDRKVINEINEKVLAA